MLSHVYSAISKFLTPGQAEAGGEEEERNKEDAHAKQFDTPTSKLQRAMRVHKDIDRTIPFDSADIKSQVILAPVPGVADAFVLHNVLTSAECEAFISITELLGFTDAPITTGIEKAEMMPDVRDNLRVMWEVPDMVTTQIWQRVCHLVPPEVTMHSTYRVNETKPLNDRFRFYRYDINQSFKPHFDGCYRKSSQEYSHYTFIIYLNDGFEGGETIFFPDGKNSLWSGRVVTTEQRVNPKRGSALVFRHTGTNSPLHEGAPHFSDGQRKYVLRSDIMYKEVEKDATTPKEM